MFGQAADWKPATDNQIMFNMGVYYLLRGLCKRDTPQGFEKEAKTNKQTNKNKQTSKQSGSRSGVLVRLLGQPSSQTSALTFVCLFVSLFVYF